MLEGEHPAPRRPEEMDPVEPELLAQVLELVREDREAPRDVVRPIRAPTAELVVEHDGPLLGEALEGPEVVVRRSRPAVQADERRAAALAGNAVPRPADGALEKSLHGHEPTKPPWYPVAAALLAQLVEHLHGKEGVDGSSPSEGFTKSPANGPFLLSAQTPCRRRRGYETGTFSDERALAGTRGLR